MELWIYGCGRIYGSMDIDVGRYMGVSRLDGYIGQIYWPDILDGYMGVSGLWQM